MEAGSTGLDVLLRLFASFYQILITIILLNLVRSGGGRGVSRMSPLGGRGGCVANAPGGLPDTVPPRRMTDTHALSCCCYRPPPPAYYCRTTPTADR